MITIKRILVGRMPCGSAAIEVEYKSSNELNTHLVMFNYPASTLPIFMEEVAETVRDTPREEVIWKHPAICKLMALME